jgi:hypothetical protein
MCVSLSSLINVSAHVCKGCAGCVASMLRHMQAVCLSVGMSGMHFACSADIWAALQIAICSAVCDTVTQLSSPTLSLAYLRSVCCHMHVVLPMTLAPLFFTHAQCVFYRSGNVVDVPWVDQNGTWWCMRQ